MAKHSLVASTKKTQSKRQCQVKCSAVPQCLADVSPVSIQVENEEASVRKRKEVSGLERKGI